MSYFFPPKLMYHSVRAITGLIIALISTLVLMASGLCGRLLHEVCMCVVCMCMCVVYVYVWCACV